MRAFICWTLLIALCALAWGKEQSAALFVEAPPPAPLELLTPRALLFNAAGTRGFVLDAGLRRVLVVDPNGRSLDALPLPADEEPAADQPADPFLPRWSLAASKGCVFLLRRDRDGEKLKLVTLDGPKKDRTLALPEWAVAAAVTVDASGRVMAVGLRMADGKCEFILGREADDGTLRGSIVVPSPTPFDGQWKNMAVTGLAAGLDGRVAAGIAQTGEPAYGFVRSWLVEVKMQGGVPERWPSFTPYTLLDGRGRVQERYRAQEALAGTEGFPPKPSVPLFTAIALGPNGLMLTGGHPADPYLRIYEKGALLRTLPREACGAQSTAILAAKDAPRLFALNAGSSRVDELALDGRVIGGFGRPVPFALAAPAALAADRLGLYVVASWDGRWRLVRFTADGRFRWARDLTPPRGLEQAQPFLATPAIDRVFVGWRAPNTAGLSWVDTVTDDGLPGLPLWDVVATTTTPAAPLCPTPLITGANGRVYLLRELKEGPRLQAVSVTGAVMQQFPPGVQGITAADSDGNLAWARQDGEIMIISRFDPAGNHIGWKRVPRPAEHATLRMVVGDRWWGWLSSTGSLLQFGDTMNVIDEVAVLDPAGERVTEVCAIAADPHGRIYLALPGRILALTPEK